MRQLGVEVNFSDGESVNLTETLRLRRSQSLIAQAQSGKQEPIRFERQGQKKKTSQNGKSFFNCPWPDLNWHRG